MTEFTPIASGAGGVLIGLAAAILLVFHGRIAGISGIAGRLVERLPKGDVAWRVAFTGGLIVTGAVAGQLFPDKVASVAHKPSWLIALAGLLVGFGTRIGSGCTSGHGVCGLGRFSMRSFAATLTFLGAGMLAVFVARQVGGG